MLFLLSLSIFPISVRSVRSRANSVRRCYTSRNFPVIKKARLGTFNCSTIPSRSILGSSQRHFLPTTGLTARKSRNRFHQPEADGREGRKVVEVVEYYHGDGEWYRSSRPLIAVPRATVLPSVFTACFASCRLRALREFPSHSTIIFRRIRGDHPWKVSFSTGVRIRVAARPWNRCNFGEYLGERFARLLYRKWYL